MQTIYEFTLPRGFKDAQGEMHRRGKMRLATAGDEIRAMRDPRVQANPSYLTLVVLSYVVLELEGVEIITATTMEQLFTADLAFLQNMYTEINDIEPPKMKVTCPSCGHVHEVPVNFTKWD